MKHPAKYSSSLLSVFDKYLPKTGKILDPFAGVGVGLKSIRPKCFLLEIEFEWASFCGGVVGDAVQMPFKCGTFDAICTSPTYGNRMADNFVDKQINKGYKRYTYRHFLGRELSPNNSGAMQWGARYRELHSKAWKECSRVLKHNGMLVLNISDHIRKGEVIPVAEWHENTIKSLGFTLELKLKVATQRQRHGVNRNIRVSHENILIFTKQ
jgi:tRNA G10  N-methylase Trm11